MKVFICSIFITVCLFIFVSDLHAQQNSVQGFGILSRIPGQWNGPVTSTTPAGNFDSWYVDFRPVSAGQISQFSLLDSQTVNNLSFFVADFNGKLMIAMRTEGCFNKQCCVTYEVIDSVNEDKGWYRFADCVAGPSRAYTTFQFTDSSFTMEVYTSKFRRETKTVIHSVYHAKLYSREYASAAISHFGYPLPSPAINLSGAFNGMNESIFFDLTGDPYGSEKQPYTGSLKVKVSTTPSLPVKQDDEYCVFLCTESLFEGLRYIPARLNSLSKYVFFPSGTSEITLRNIHPGRYYVYSFCDRNGDKKHKKGDYMSSRLDHVINIKAGETTETGSIIDLLIP
jgi:hypothetical protein